MLLLLIIVLLITVSIASFFSGTTFQIKTAHAWWDNNWNYCRKIKINSSQVDEALTNFPVLLYLNSSRINWTNVQDNLDDLRFIADDNSTELKYEIENYTINNEAWIWVKIPSVANTSDTVFFMYYGNAGASSSEDATNVWDSNFTMVHHMDNYNTTHIADSTSNDYDGTKKGTNEPIEISNGKIDSAQNFDGSDDYVNGSITFDLDATNITIEAWVYFADFDAGHENPRVIEISDADYSVQIIRDSTSSKWVTKHSKWQTGIIGTEWSVPSNGTWYYVAAVFDTSANTTSFYVDSTSQSGGANNNIGLGNETNKFYLGTRSDFVGTAFLKGYIDEVRLSNTARSAAWIKASYYSGMGTLLTFGSEERGNTAPTIGEFEAPATVYANKYFFLNVTIDDQDGVADFVNATVEISHSVVLKWDNASDTFSEQSDTNNYCFLDVGNSVSASVNSTAYKLSWKIKLAWDYTEGTVDVVATNTKVYDDWGDSGSGSYSNLFTFEDDLIIHTDANVDDNRVNPSDTVTFIGTIYYEGTATVPEDITGITAYVELSGTQKGSDINVASGQYSITLNTESSVGLHSYNIYATTDQNTVTNHTVSVIVDRIIVSYKAVNDSRLNVNDDVAVRFRLRSEHDGTAVQSGSLSINGSSATWDAGNSWWKLTDSQSSVNNYTYHVSAVNWDTEEITALNSGVATNVTWTVFDRLQIQSYNVDDSRVNVSTNVDINVTIWFDYDDTVCTTATITINGHSAIHQENGIYRITRTSASVTSETYNNVACTAEAAYGIIVVDQNGQSATVIWDRLIVSYKGNDDSRRDYGTAGQVRFKIRSEYDGAFVTSGSVSINGTSATWDSPNSRWYISTGTVNSVEKRTYVVTAVNWDTHGITTLNSGVATNATEIIWDRLEIVLKGATDSRVDVDASSYVYFNVTREYDSVVFDDSKGTVFINGSSATWDSTSKYWKLSVSQSSVGRWTYQVSSISDTEFGIAVINDAVGSQEAIWDRVCSATAMTSSNNYVNYNSENCWYTTLKLEYDGTAITSGTMMLNTGTMTYSNSRWEYNYTKNAVGTESRNIVSVSGIAYDITALNSNATVSASCTYDRIDVVTYSSVDGRIDVNTEGCYYFTLKYESDSSAVDDGTATLNGSLSLTYVSARSRWEYNTTKSTAQSLVVHLLSVEGNTRGITVLNSEVSSKTVEIIWDRLIVNVSADSNAPTVGTQVNFTVTAVYDYDSAQVTAWTVNIYRNSTHFASGNFSDTQYSEVSYQYTIENVTETSYGLTAFTSNTETVSWGGLQIEIYEIAIDDGRIDVGTNAYMHFHCRFNVNGSDCTTGTLIVNGTNYNINGTGWATVTVSFATVGKRIYTVTGVNVNGETDFSQTPSNPEVVWDSLSINISGPMDQRIDIGSNASGIIVSATYDYDGTDFDGTLTLNDTTYNYNTVGRRGYTVSSASGDSYGITAISSNDETYCIWDRVLVYYFQVNDTRTDINSYVNVTVKAELEYDHHALGTGDSLSFNSTTLIWNGVSFTNNTLTKAIVGNWTLTIDNAYENTYGITAYAINITSPWIVFDRVNITSFSVTDNRINIGATPSFSVSGEYEYDGTAWSGTYMLNDTASKSNVGRYNYSIASITDSNYGLTVFQQSAPDVYVIFDRINVIISADGTYVVLNTQVNFTVTAIYEYDLNPVTSWTVNIYRNSTHFATGNFTDTQASPSIYEYTVENITESTFGLTVFQSNMVTVEWYNIPPVASFTYSPAFPITGETVTFNASTSYDPDGTITIYRWDFGDGTAIETSPTPTITHMYETIGNHTVTLTVIDNDDSENKTEATITIIGYPTADFVYSPTYPIAGETVTFDASTSTPNGGTIVDYFWDFGDGTNSTGLVTSHIYNAFGTYLVTLEIVDSEQLTNSTSRLIDVRQLPTANFTYSPSLPMIGETVIFNASLSEPNGGTILTYTWDFGDTQTGTGIVINHTYSTYGTHNVTLTITDSEGLSNVYIQTIRIIIKPTADFMYAPTYPVVNQSVLFDASISYDSDGIVAAYTWNFGDGNITTTENPSIRHVFRNASMYDVTLTITDNDGLTETITRQITVYTTVVSVHDIAIINIKPEFSWVYQGQPLNITVAVANEGTDVETFNVTLYYDNTEMETFTIFNLFPGRNLTLTFTWNTTNLYPTQYNISAVANIMPEETDINDNSLIYGTITVLWTGDINHDGRVDMRDIAAIARGFGSHTGEPRYDPNCDLNSDGKIDMRDIAPAAKNFGKP